MHHGDHKSNYMIYWRENFTTPSNWTTFIASFINGIPFLKLGTHLMLWLKYIFTRKKKSYLQRFGGWFLHSGLISCQCDLNCFFIDTLKRNNRGWTKQIYKCIITRFESKTKRIFFHSKGKKRFIFVFLTNSLLDIYYTCMLY